MKFCAIPNDETQRLHALYKLQLLDTPPEERFDLITEKAMSYFSVTNVLVSLIDKNRQWFKSKQGTSTCETARDISFCGHAINYDDVFVVNDTHKDERFCDNPLVTEEPHIRFYAGCPIKTRDGYAVGTLCLIDSQPKLLTDSDISMLRKFALMVESQLNLQVGSD
jgi:GAF domain-containing protein